MPSMRKCLWSWLGTLQLGEMEIAHSNEPGNRHSIAVRRSFAWSRENDSLNHQLRASSGCVKDSGCFPEIAGFPRVWLDSSCREPRPRPALSLTEWRGDRVSFGEIPPQAPRPMATARTSNGKLTYTDYFLIPGDGRQYNVIDGSQKRIAKGSQKETHRQRSRKRTRTGY